MTAPHPLTPVVLARSLPPSWLSLREVELWRRLAPLADAACAAAGHPPVYADAQTSFPHLVRVMLRVQEYAAAGPLLAREAALSAKLANRMAAGFFMAPIFPPPPKERPCPDDSPAP